MDARRPGLSDADALSARAAILATGLPAPALAVALREAGWRRWLTGPAARRRRLAAVAALLAEGPDAGFWTTPMPWLGGRTPAGTLARRDGIGVVGDLLIRINHGIPP